MFADSVDVLTYGTTTERGRVVPDYTTTPGVVTLVAVDVQPGVSQEMLATHRIGVDVMFTVYVPATQIPVGVTINAQSVIRYAGERFQVTGRPESWAGQLGHLVIYLTEWTST